jgi:hypothetical protein
VSAIEHRTRVESLAHEPADTLELNSIGVVSLHLLRPVAFDRYAENRATGAFILIDPATNATVAAGMIAAVLDTESSEQDPWGAVTVGEREARWGHRGGVLELSGSSVLIDAVERSLFTIGAVTSRIDAEDAALREHPQITQLLAKAQSRSGLLTLLVHAEEAGALTATVEGEELVLEDGDYLRVVSAVHQLLHRKGILISTEKANL